MKMLDPSLISSGARARILDAFNRLNERNVLNLSDELNQQDRITFEMAVLESYGFAHLFPRIRAAVLELHRIRAVAREPA